MQWLELKNRSGCSFGHIYALLFHEIYLLVNQIPQSFSLKLYNIKFVDLNDR